MQKVAIDDVEGHSLGEESVRRGLSSPVGATEMAINQYRLAPGDELPGGLHAHMDQEEVFVVLAGQATFETMNGTITVHEDEIIRFAPGEFQSGANKSNSELVVIALGAPRRTEDIRIPVDCPDCQHPNLRLETSERELVFSCPDCDRTHRPQECPACGQSDLRVKLDRDQSQEQTVRTVVVCSDCSAHFDRPPLE